MNSIRFFALGLVVAFTATSFAASTVSLQPGSQVTLVAGDTMTVSCSDGANAPSPKRYYCECEVYGGYYDSKITWRIQYIEFDPITAASKTIKTLRSGEAFNRGGTGGLFSEAQLAEARKTCQSEIRLTPVCNAGRP